MDIWSWICDLPNSEELFLSNSPLTIQLASSKQIQGGNDTTRAILLKAEGTFESNSKSSDEPAVTFSVCYEQQVLWISDPCPLHLDKPFLPLVLQLLQEIISRSPTAQDSTCPRSQLQKLKPDPVSWILDSHSPESFSSFFNVIFLTHLFWICACDAPPEIGSLYFHSLLAPNLETFSRTHTPALRTFLLTVGADVELCLMRAVGYMLTKWLITGEVGGGGLRLLTPLPKPENLGFSYATESNGLWVLKGYTPVKAMNLYTSFNSQNNFKYPVIEAKESVLRYALAHQQLEAVIQLEYSVGFHDGFIQVKARINNFRLHVAKLGFNKKEDDAYADERHFPSRIRVWVGPEVGATYVGGLSLGRSTDNVEREMEVLRIVRESFDDQKVPNVKATARMSTRAKMKNWRWDQDAEGNAAIFEAVLCENTTGMEVASWKPFTPAGSSNLGGDQLGSSFRRRYKGAGRTFTKAGGLVFAGEECGEGVEWRLSKEMEGSVLKWRIGGRIWLSYFPDNVKSSYFETRYIEWCDEVDLPLIPAKS